MVLPENTYPGTFFAIEGPDGCGKSTQIDLLKEHFRARKDVIFTKEPGRDRSWGSKIYQELETDRPDGLHRVDLFTFQTWYAHDSKSHLENLIIPNLKNGNLVITDRFRASMVYGAVSPNKRELELELAKLMNMNRSIIGLNFIWPNAVIILDTSPEACLERSLKKNRNLDGHEKIETITRVLNNYKVFAGIFPNCHIVNGNRSIEEIFADIKVIISDK